MYLRQIGKKWYFTIVVKLPNGKKKKIERVGGKTKKEAREAALALIREEDASGVYHETIDITLGECVKKWLESVEMYYAPGTHKSYQYMAKKHIIEPLGEIKLGKLTAVLLQETLTNLAKDYSRSTVTTVYTIFRKSLDMAVNQYHWIPYNPVHAIMGSPRRKAKVSVPTKLVFTKEELEKIFLYFRNKMNYYVPLQLAYHMGLRAGECLALKWGDIDFKNRFIYVHATLFERAGTKAVVLERTKNGKARKLAMDDQIIEILKKQKEDQEKNKQAYQELYYDSDFVCTREDGKPALHYSIRYLNRWFKQNGINGHFHMLRHTHATMLLEAGIDIDYVSKRLGHSNINITASTYLHVTQKREKEATDIMNKIL